MLLIGVAGVLFWLVARESVRFQRERDCLVEREGATSGAGGGECFFVQVRAAATGRTKR